MIVDLTSIGKRKQQKVRAIYLEVEVLALPREQLLLRVRRVHGTCRNQVSDEKLVLHFSLMLLDRSQNREGHKFLQRQKIE